MTAAFSKLAPAEGALGADFESARWLPITFDLDVDAGKLPMVHGSLGTEELVIYDGSGFAPSFADHSWVSQVGQKFSFSLLPMGGWHKTPITIKPGQFAEASALADQAISLDRSLSQYASIADAAIGESGIRLVRASNQYLAVPYASQTGLDMTSVVAFDMRFRFRSLPSTEGTSAQLTNRDETGQRAYSLAVSTQDKLYIAVYDSVGVEYLVYTTDAVPWATNRYYRVSGYCDLSLSGTKIRLWIDGVEQAVTVTGTAPATIHAGTSDFAVGGFRGVGRLEGDIDYLRVFARRPTDAEIASGIYASTEQRAYYEFRGAPTDLSGNGNDLTLVNAPTYLKSLDIIDELTLVGWLAPGDTSPESGVEGYYYWATKWSDTSNQRSYAALMYKATDDSHRLTFLASPDGIAGHIYHVDFPDMEVNAWDHVIVRFSPRGGATFADQVSIWVNGVKRSTLATTGGAVSGLFSSSADFRVGMRGSATTVGWRGKVAGIEAWNRLWSDAECQAMKPDNLIGLCTDNSLDGVYTDDSGHGNTLTPASSPTFTIGPRPAISPAAGQLAATEDAARHTPISVSVESPSAQHKPIVWARVGDNPWQWHTVYDGDDFNPLFAPSSVENSGGIHTFSVLPLGGWWRSPVELTWGTFEEAIHVPNQAPTASFTFTDGATDFEAQFTDASSDPDGTIASWLWDFGDGTESTEQNPSHTYADSTPRTVTLTVTDDQGAQASVQQEVEPSGGGVSEITTSLLTSGASTADLTSYDTASVLPAVDAAIYAIVATFRSAGEPVTPTASGNGLTWVEVATQVLGSRRMTVFRAMGSSPSAGAITFDFGSEVQDTCVWDIVECAGADTTGTSGSGATLQPMTTTSGATTSYSVSLASPLGDAANVNITALARTTGSGTIAEDPDFTALSDDAASGVCLGTQEGTGQQSCDGTTSTSAGYIAIAWEVKAA